MSSSSASQARPTMHDNQIASVHVPARGLSSKQQTHQSLNVGSTERSVSILGGAALIGAGLSRGRLSGLLITLAGGGLLYRGLTGHCYTYQALGIDTTEHADNTVIPAQAGTKVEKSVIINRPIGELYSYWRDLENLPKCMRHLKSVKVLDDNRSRWVAEGPLGVTLQWQAEVFNEREPELIAWRSLPGSQVATTGSVRFKDLGNGRGTSVTVSLKYDPPGGKIGSTVAWLMGRDAEQEVDEDLRQFKSRMEGGGVPTIENPPSDHR